MKQIQQLRAKERGFGKGYWSQNWPLLGRLGVLLLAEGFELTTESE